MKANDLMIDELKNLDNRVMLSGKAILSTITTMGQFGNLAESVLNKYGIEEIDQEKRYPFELRSLIHEAALKKYGVIALVVMGFKSAEINKGGTQVKHLLDRCDQLSKKLC